MENNHSGIYQPAQYPVILGLEFHLTAVDSPIQRERSLAGYSWREKRHLTMNYICPASNHPRNPFKMYHFSGLLPQSKIKPWSLTYVL